MALTSNPNKFDRAELAALQAGLLLLGKTKSLPDEIHLVATDGNKLSPPDDTLINSLLLKLLEEEKKCR